MIQVNSDQVRMALSRGEALCKRANPYYHVASIIIVGGIIQKDGCLPNNDFFPLTHFINSFVQLGASFSDGLTVQACNLKYRDDFLRDTPKADLLIFPWVNNNVSDPDDDKIGAESPLLGLGYTWDNAIHKSQSAFVGLVTDNSDCVLGRKDVPPNYAELHYTRKKFVYDYPLFKRRDLQLAR